MADDSGGRLRIGTRAEHDHGTHCEKNVDFAHYLDLQMGGRARTPVVLSVEPPGEPSQDIIDARAGRRKSLSHLRDDEDLQSLGRFYAESGRGER
jgi:hypothetical protein